MVNKRDNSKLQLKSVWDEPSFYALFDEHGKTKQTATKIWRYLISNPKAELTDVPIDQFSIPRVIGRGMVQRFHKFTSKVITRQDSARDDTVKLLIELQDGHHIETVIMKHEGRVTVCVSSQIGCKMGCKFCATGTMGIIGDLTAGEIIEQLVHASQIAKVRNVVFMGMLFGCLLLYILFTDVLCLIIHLSSGMGEPLNNFDNVKLAVQFMVDTKRFSLSPRHVTVSTVGVVSAMYRLTRELPGVSLALSLHAATQDVRLKIVPAASAHPIEKLLDAVDNHISSRLATSGGKVTANKDLLVMLEYILIKDINDRAEHAHQLGELLKSRREYVILNIIPYNPTDVAEDFFPPTEEQIDIFFRICAGPPYSLHVRRRREMGQDIDGACGQLAVVKKGNKKQDDADIEDIASSLKKSRKAKSTKQNKKSLETAASMKPDSRYSSILLKFGRYRTYNLAVVLAMASYHPLRQYFWPHS